MKKPGRNDSCVCGSGKKFKKCCERKMIGKKFMATKIDTATSIPSFPHNTSVASFFQRKITQIKSEKQLLEERKDAPKKINANIKDKDNFETKVEASSQDKKEDENLDISKEKTDSSGLNKKEDVLVANDASKQETLKTV